MPKDTQPNHFNCTKKPLGWRRFYVIGFCVFMLTTGQAMADTIHLQNGKTVQGKLDSVTGDVIEFREKNSFGSKMDFYRIQLSNRHDMVETWGKHRYYGEIIYQDKFKLELKTAAGIVRLNRLKITNVVLGTPTEQPVSFNQGLVQPQAQAAMKNIRPSMSPKQAPAETPATDGAEIPAVVD